MIAHLNGDFETVDYLQDKSIRLYDNVENEEYPPHWHNAIEIIMPLISTYTVICSGKQYDCGGIYRTELRSGCHKGGYR